MTHPSAKGYVPSLVNHSWCTPEWVLKACKKAVGTDQFSLDPCSNSTSIVHAKTEFRLPEKNGLHEEWNYPTIFVNCPYGTCHVHKTLNTEFEGKWGDADKATKALYETTSIEDWLFKCSQAQVEYNSHVLALIPATPETVGWRKWIWAYADAVCFVKKRIKFIDPVTGKLCTQGFPKPHAIVYWGDNFKRFYDVMRDVGTVVPAGGLLDNMIQSLI